MCLGDLGKVGQTWDEGGLPMAFVDGEPVCLMYTPEATTGDSVLISLGYAVEIIDPKRAADAVALRESLEMAVFGKENP